ncbi:MAG TPA: GatB/YqeY domain-containing protein [Myxococcota bacterium]
MPLNDDINTAWKEAMKARDPKKDALAAIRTEVKNKLINSRGAGVEEAAPTDELVLEVLAKMAKQRKESIDEYTKAGRDDLLEKEQLELGVVESYLPKQLDESVVDDLVREAIAETGSTSAKDMGKAMKAAMAKVAGRADGKIVQARVKALLPN